MKEWIIASGKGGAGKTSFVAAMAQYFGPRAVLADCDVDAADLALLMGPEPVRREDFQAGRKAVIDRRWCRGCGRCQVRCPFEAISREAPLGPFRVDPLVCEGCGSCADVCPHAVIGFEPNHCGEWYVSRTRFDSAMVHARLNPGEDNSGKLVQEVKRQARAWRQDERAEWLLVDGPPGIGCPAIASLSGADGLLLLAEAGASGLHDARRLHELARKMGVPCLAVLNKTGLSQGQDAAARQWLESAGIKLLGEIPYDEAYIEALRGGRTWLEIDQAPVRDRLVKIFETLDREMETS